MKDGEDVGKKIWVNLSTRNRSDAEKVTMWDLKQARGAGATYLERMIQLME